MRVLLDTHMLIWGTCPFTELSGYRFTYCIGNIALRSSSLDDYAAIEVASVISIVEFRMIRMYGMGIVSTDHE